MRMGPWLWGQLGPWTWGQVDPWLWGWVPCGDRQDTGREDGSLALGVGPWPWGQMGPWLWKWVPGHGDRWDPGHGDWWTLAVRMSQWLWHQGDRSLAVEVRLLSSCGDKLLAM